MFPFYIEESSTSDSITDNQGKATFNIIPKGMIWSIAIKNEDHWESCDIIGWPYEWTTYKLYDQGKKIGHTIDIKFVKEKH